MRILKSSFLFLMTALLITACNKSDVAERVYNPQNQPYEIARAQEGFLEDDELMARENLDLQAIGSLLERANSAEDFEYLLNSDDGINNLDLNDDGYADYISVREFDERYDNERGFSLFSQFGPELIQEIAQIILDRDGYDDGDYPGSRVLIRGNDYLYGDDYYYETNWLDRRVTFVDWVFSDRDSVYRSPYYYENYPKYYEPYQVVETPVYLSRIERYYDSPFFVQTAQPTITDIRVDSPYREVSLSEAFMRAPRERIAERRQKVLVERDDQRAQFDRERPGKMKDFSVREDRDKFNDNPNRAEKRERFQNDRPQEMRDKPDKAERFDRQAEKQQKFERQAEKQQKFERPQQQQKFEREQQKAERQQQKAERQNQQRFERRQENRAEKQQMKQERQQQKQENRVKFDNGGGNPNKGGGGNPNKGGGNGNGNGGGNKGGGGDNKGGGGGGKGKGKG